MIGKRISNSFQEIISDGLALVYPSCCYACDKRLAKNEQLICLHCRYEMPRLNYWNWEHNPIEKIFHDQIHIRAAGAFLSYSKDGPIKNILKHIKYRNQSELAVHVGFMLGQELRKSPRFKFDCIAPVPLHKNKMRSRSYNQANKIAIGISRAVEKPLISDALIRVKAAASQTKKGRLSRWQLIKDCFSVNESHDLKGKRILLVDDVITTGATLTACTSKLVDHGVADIYIAALAFARI